MSQWPDRHTHAVATTHGASGSWEENMKMGKLRVSEMGFKNQEFKRQ